MTPDNEYLLAMPEKKMYDRFCRSLVVSNRCNDIITVAVNVKTSKENGYFCENISTEFYQ